MKVPQLKKEITDNDVITLGLMSGIEIHQQIEGRKLFCNCPTEIRDDEPDFLVKRFLRALAGESGKVDKAALAEMRKKKYNAYQGYNDTTCLVELDEEPPGNVNVNALVSALQVAKVFKASVVDQVRFMRKTVVDGSNTSGFQRTGLIAVDGCLKTKGGLDVGIESICLEEDSAKKVSSSKEFEVYNLSRLGIPLIEIATAPDLRTPDQIKVVAEHIGMVLRSLHNVKRGLGTIRQDVNVSIKQGCRVEIKGAQDLKMIPTLAKHEMLRQHNLLQIFKELKERKATVGGLTDVTKLFVKCDSKVVSSALSKEDGVVYALPLCGYSGITGLEIQPGRRYGSELSDHAKVMGVKGLFHADELPNYGISKELKDAVYKELSLDSSKDNFLLIADDKNVAMRALNAAKNRASDFTLHKEVRMALPDGNSSYMRPMPGAARMYPETDVKPVMVDISAIEVPQLLSERINDLKDKYNLSEEIAKRLVKDNIDFDNLCSTYKKVKPAFIIDLLYSMPSVVKKKFNVEVNDYNLYLEEVLKHVDKVSKDAIPEIISLLVKGEKVDYKKYKTMDASEVEKVVKEVIKADPKAPIGALMGLAMKKLGGKADGKLVNELIKKHK